MKNCKRINAFPVPDRNLTTLLMVNYEADPCLLQPFVPSGTEIDFWYGPTFVSVVGFHFLKTRVCGSAVPGHQNYPEVYPPFFT